MVKLLQCNQVRLHILQSALNALGSRKLANAEAYHFAQSRCKVIDDSNLSAESLSLRLVAYQRKIHEEATSSLSKSKVMRCLVATQDGDVRTELRKIPGVPILYANKVTLVLETPSETSKTFNHKVMHLSPLSSVI